MLCLFVIAPPAFAVVEDVSSAGVADTPPTTTTTTTVPAEQSQGADSSTPEKPPPGEKLVLRNPRATMAAFLSAIDKAQRGQIEHYVDALACLDLTGLSELPEDARVSQGRKLAALLNAFITKHGVELELIPDNPQGKPYVYNKSADGRTIQIVRAEDDVWRFTWDSLAFVQSPPPEAPVEQVSPAAAKPAASPPTVQAAPAPPAPSTQVPTEHRSAQATMRAFLEAMKDGEVEEASRCLDLSDIAVVARSEKGEELVYLLHKAIKWTKDVVLPVIPDDPLGIPYILRQDELGIIVIARQGEGSDRPGYWLFTKKTVAGLDVLYEALEKQAKQEEEALRRSGQLPEAQAEEEGAALPLSLQLRSSIPEPLKGTWFLLKHWQWLGLLALLLLGMLVYKLTIVFLRTLTGFWLRRRGVTVDERVQRSSFRPVGILAASAVWWLGLTWLALRADVLMVLLLAVKFVTCWAMVWTVYRAVDLLCNYFAFLAARTESRIDDLLVPLVRKVAKVAVTVVGIVFIVEQFTEGRPLQLLAGLGLGGLALALAAQDSLKNLFGSLTVIADRPFQVGDWVHIGDVDGTVESVGFRSTRVRTFYNSQVVVPNATLMNATIDNYGARKYRRASVTLSITYSTPPDRIDAFCEGIRELIRLHPYTRKDYYHVYLNKFGPSSLDILLYVFWEVPDWSTELRERHRLFVDILRLAQKMGVEFAFPTQTVWLERRGGEASDSEHLVLRPGKDDPCSAGLELAAGVFKEAYGADPKPRGPVVINHAPLSEREPGEETDEGNGS